MTWDWRRFSRGTRFFFGSVLTVLALGAAGYALWTYLALPGRLMLTGCLGLLLASVLLRGSRYIVWLIGVAAVLAPAALLLLAHRFAAEAADRTAIIGMLQLYGAGMVGGLVLELLEDKRYVLEKPYLDTRPDNLRKDTMVRSGPRWNLGFLSRLLIGGLAAVVLVTLFGTLVGNFDVAQASQPAALASAVATGSAAPAVWKRLSDAVIKRSDAIDALLDGLPQPGTPGPPPPPPPPGAAAPAEQGQTQDRAQLTLMESHVLAIKHLK